MDIVKLFKNSLIYPTTDWNKLLIFGVLIVILSILTILGAFGLSLSQYIGADILAVVSLILLIIITLIIYGYTLSITRKTINNVEGSIPELNLIDNIIDGVKVLVLRIVYYIIPAVVTLIVAYATGVFGYIYQLIPYYMAYGSAAVIPQNLLLSAGTSFLIVLLVAGILFIIFELLLTIARATLAETENLLAAINFMDVFAKIGEIGWGNYIIWIITYVIIIFVISFVSGLVSVIPFIGVIIALLLFKPYIEMFSARALGLIYNESKE